MEWNMAFVENERLADGVVRLTLNRPDKANALDTEIVEALLAGIETARAGGTRLLVFAGAGRHFCAGFDLSDLDTISDGDLLHRFVRIETLLQTVFHLPFATLALAHGRVMGAGADLFSACSRRAAAPGTVFRMPGLGFGILLGTRRLAARIGDDAARRIQNETRAFDVEEAVRLGFATETAPDTDWPDLIEAATEVAHTLSPAATAALYSATVRDTRDRDMADLVASASAPGLRDRIRAYRDKTLKKRS
jgi:enoyl-CoA hydratase/carnithine racemase